MPKRQPWFIFFLFLLSVALLFAHLGLAPLWKAEARIAEVVREMILKKDYLHPTCLWVPYVTKPLVPYWLCVVFYKLRGTLDELTLRLPVAMLAAFATAATALIGRRLYNLKTGLFSGFFLVTCYGFITWGRCAAPDMLNVSAIIVSVAWYLYRIKDERIADAFILGLLMGLSGQMKGLVGIVIPAMLVFLHLLIYKRLHLLLRPGLLIAFLLGLSGYLIPFILSFEGKGAGGYNWLYMAIHESVLRAVSPFDHKGSVFTYVEFVPIWMLPWTPLFLGMVLFHIARWKRLGRQVQWLFLSFVAIFFLFTMAGSRRSYYILPILPLAAIITGSCLEFLKDGLVRKAVHIQIWFFFLVAIVLVMSPLLSLWDSFPLPARFFIMPCIQGIFVLSVLFFGLMRIAKDENSVNFLVIMAVSGFIITSGFVLFIKPYFDVRQTEKPFILKVKKRCISSGQTPLYLDIGPRTRARLDFYLDLSVPIRNISNLNGLVDAISTKNRGSLLLLAEASAQKDMKDLLHGLEVRNLFCQRVLPWQGWPKRQARLRRSRLCLFEIIETQERGMQADRLADPAHQP